MDYLRMLFSVENKVAVVTGGSGILGGEMAKGLLLAGAKVVLLARNEENLKHKVETLGRADQEVVGLKCNVLDEENIRDVNDR